MNRLTSERLEALLARAKEVRILVVGDLMLDVYLRGVASRISPEAPVPVVKIEEEWRALGGAANVASNVVALGASCQLVGCIGADHAGEDLREQLGRLGIDAGLVTTRKRPTTVKTRIMARRQQVARYDREEEAEVDAECADLLCRRIREAAPDIDAIVLEDYNKGVLVPAVIHTALEAARRFDKPIVIDPKSRYFFDYGGATIFKPNLVELAAALREPVRADDAEWMERVRSSLGCDHLLLTLGEDGMALMTAAGEHVHVPAAARSVYDVSGAGDTVTAMVAVALAAGANPAEAAIMANHAAGIEVAKAGVATVSPDELRAVVREVMESGEVFALPRADYSS